jgi:D-alanyl-D-alanine dipeptidase
MFSERGVAYWAGLRRLHDTCEADFGTPLDPAISMAAVRSYAETCAMNAEESARPFILAGIMEAGFFMYARSRTSHRLGLC